MVVVRIVFLKSVRSLTNLNLSTDVPQLSQAFLPFRVTSYVTVTPYSIQPPLSSFLYHSHCVPACSSRSDIGERCEVRRSAKKEKRGSPPLLFIAFFTSHCSPLSERFTGTGYCWCAKTLLSCLIRLCRQSSKIRPVIVFFLLSCCQSLLSLHLYWMRICS